MSLTIWRGDDIDRLLSKAAEADERTTSLLPSPPIIDGERPVAEQAVAVARKHGLDEPPELADFVVDLLDADELLDKPCWHMSRGERQMVGLILAFARPFERLILIDPTAGLDARRSASIVDFLIDLGADHAVDVASNAEIFGSL